MPLLYSYQAGHEVASYNRWYAIGEDRLLEIDEQDVEWFMFREPLYRPATAEEQNRYYKAQRKSSQLLEEAPIQEVLLEREEDTQEHTLIPTRRGVTIDG